MELISTHVGADFDALASMLAARKLFPGARLFFPGSREESVRRMVDAGFIEVPELRQRDIDPQEIQRIVLCDIRQRDRIGVIDRWLSERPSIELLAYDHHPDSPTDLEVDGGRVDPSVGSTSTLLVEELQGRSLAVSSAEATVLMMGIYEDTGSLSYPATDPRDLAAAAWLIRQGGDLEAVRRFALRPLDPRRLEVLHRMTEALEVHRVHGHRVGIVALELGVYIDELAPLVSRCLELFELPALFAIFGEAERVTVIARGEIAGFDLGEAMASFAGGGGHRTAAAASLRGMTAIQVRERLLSHLRGVLPPAGRAADLMLTSFLSLPADLTVGAAKERINQWRVNAAPVIEAGDGRRVVGAVTRQILDAAIQHGLGDRPLERVMERNVEWVEPTAPAEEIARRMLAGHPRFVLVGDEAEGLPEGLVTRMQILRHLHGRLEEGAGAVDRHAREQRRWLQSAGRLLEEGAPSEVLPRLRAIAEVAREHEIRVALVGGFVRDLLLGRENRDLDLVVEGDGPDFARLLAARLDGRVRVHEAFLTAVVIDPEGFRIDVATARSEFYRAPAALPEVQTSALRQDLYRRDFTINTLAIRLGPGDTPELIDYFGGRRDLKEGTLRVLHSLSFIDDPTRALRAVRLEQRLGFSISPETLRLLEVALNEGVFERLSGSRLREELALLLDDPRTAERGIARLAELGLLGVLHPGLDRLGPGLEGRLQQAVAAYDWFVLEGLSEPEVTVWRMFLLALAHDLGPDERRELAERLALAGEERELLEGFPGRLEGARTVLGRSGARPHQVAAALDRLTGEEALLLMALEGGEVRAWVRRWLTELRPLELQIRGADLVARGIAPGPVIGAALEATRRARLDGEIGASEEIDYALAWIRSGAGKPVAAPGGEPGGGR